MRKKIAVITGASSGLGREFARLLVKRSELDEIWAIARRADKLGRLQRDLGRKIIPLSIDLAKTEEILRFQQILQKHRPVILYEINAAGYAKFCAYSDLNVAQSIKMIQVNCGGVVGISVACIPYMVRGSHMLNIASLSEHLQCNQGICVQLFAGITDGAQRKRDFRHNGLPRMDEYRSDRAR